MDYPTLHRIEIFPIKSLDGVTLDHVSVLPSGALKGDRQYAIMDAQGQFVNAKSTARIHKLRATFSSDLNFVTLQISETGQHETLSLSEPRTDLDDWLSEYFGKPVTVQQNIINGFPDDLNAPGPTLISTETLDTVAQWFPELDKTELRRRLRTNLELSGAPPFWEDRLFGKGEDGVQFQIGAVALIGVNPCQRCIVPTRSSLDGTAYSSFQKQFVQKRQKYLPDWAAIERFNHFYKLAVNTCLVPNSMDMSLNLGDPVTICTEVPKLY